MIDSPAFWLAAVPAVLIVGLSKGGFGGGHSSPLRGRGGSATSARLAPAESPATAIRAPRSMCEVWKNFPFKCSRVVHKLPTADWGSESLRSTPGRAPNTGRSTTGFDSPRTRIAAPLVALANLLWHAGHNH